MSSPENVASSFMNRATAQGQTPQDGGNIFFLFHGLMCFAYNYKTGLCELGMHSKAPEHEFKIFALQLDLSSPYLASPIYAYEPDSYDDIPGGVITFDVEEPMCPGVHYHLPPQDDYYTWNQILDLELGDFYNRKLKKVKNVLKPKITINHGLFYVIPTSRLFRRVEDSTTNGSDLGTIVYFAVCAVKHRYSGTVKLSTPREELTLHGSTDRPLLIVISNSCGDYCTSNASDFPLYYKAFKIRSNEKRYHLETSGRRPQVDLSAVSIFSNLFTQEPLKSILSNPDSPCGAAGYGRSAGIDDSGT